MAKRKKLVITLEPKKGMISIEDCNAVLYASWLKKENELYIYSSKYTSFKNLELIKNTIDKLAVLLEDIDDPRIDRVWLNLYNKKEAITFVDKNTNAIQVDEENYDSMCMAYEIGMAMLNDYEIADFDKLMRG